MSNSSAKIPTVIHDYDPRNLPPKYLQAIGLATAAASQTESILEEFIGALLKIDNIQSLALATHMSNPIRNDIIRTLAELESPTIDDLDQIDDLMDTLQEALNKRNAIVHNSLFIHGETGEIVSQRITARGSLKLELKPIAVEEIEKDAEFIYKAGMDVMDFMMSRGLGSYVRTKPLQAPVNRKKAARKKRRSGNK